MDINGVAGRDLGAMLAPVAGTLCRALLAIKGLGHQPGKGRLADTPDTAENDGMGYAVPVNGILQRPDYRLLSDNFLKCLGTPFSG